jgi:hypothetical protein
MEHLFYVVSFLQNMFHLESTSHWVSFDPIFIILNCFYKLKKLCLKISLREYVWNFFWFFKYIFSKIYALIFFKLKNIYLGRKVFFKKINFFQKYPLKKCLNCFFKIQKHIFEKLCLYICKTFYKNLLNNKLEIFEKLKKKSWKLCLFFFKNLELIQFFKRFFFQKINWIFF